MNPLQLFRTLEHVTVGQAAARVRHELWMRTRKKLGWSAGDRHALSGVRLPLPREELPRLDAMIELWQRGNVEYVGLAGGNADWRGAGKPKLWRYERHYHDELVALAARAHSEPDGPWAIEAREMQDEWADACPPERGDAWEPYPTARRILSWSEAVSIEPSIAAEEMAARLASHLRHLSAHLEHHLRGNHLLCDAAALIAGGAVLADHHLDGEPDPLGAEAMREGADLLERELEAQVLPDGGYAERTVQYHALVLKDALLALELAQARKLDLRPRIGERLSKMALWLWRARRSDDTWPLVNDAAPHAFALAREALARAERLLLFTAPTPGATVTSLPDTGWTFLRDVGCELFFDTGPIGPREQPGHGHNDALAYELRWFGLPVVTDSGVTTYQRDSIRAFERAPQAHATVSVDGCGVDEPWAAFRVAGRGTVESVKVDTSTIDTRLRLLRGRARSYAGFFHQRTLVFWPARALLVFDRVQDARTNAAIFSYVPLDPGWSAAEASGALFLLGPGARGLQLHLHRGTLERLARGVESPRDGWVGQGFGKPVARTSVILRADKNGRCLYSIVAPGVTLRETERGLALRAPGAEIVLDLEGLN